MKHTHGRQRAHQPMYCVGRETCSTRDLRGSQWPHYKLISDSRFGRCAKHRGMHDSRGHIQQVIQGHAPRLVSGCVVVAVGTSRCDFRSSGRSAGTPSTVSMRKFLLRRVRQEEASRGLRGGRRGERRASGSSTASAGPGLVGPARRLAQPSHIRETCGVDLQSRADFREWAAKPAPAPTWQHRTRTPPRARNARLIGVEACGRGIDSFGANPGLKSRSKKLS